MPFPNLLFKGHMVPAASGVWEWHLLFLCLPAYLWFSHPQFLSSFLWPHIFCLSFIWWQSCHDTTATSRRWNSWRSFLSVSLPSFPATFQSMQCCPLHHIAHTLLPPTSMRERHSISCSISSEHVCSCLSASLKSSILSYFLLLLLPSVWEADWIVLWPRVDVASLR